MKNKQTWDHQSVQHLFELPFMDLMYQAQQVHRQHFDPNVIQLSTIISIKTGSCPEDCSYCSQSGHYHTNITRHKLLSLEKVLDLAKQAKEFGATRFCMGAAWRSPSARDFPKVLEIISAVKALGGLDTCVTLGMLTGDQAKQLKAAGLDFYNHNLDTSPEYYKKIITTRIYQDRLDTLQYVRDAGINVCCGGILGMGESRDDRIGLLLQLANLPTYPESVPINRLIKMKGTPLADVPDFDDFEFIRTIAAARIMMPRAYVRLSAGRHEFDDHMHALCFLAGANSIHYGFDIILTAANRKKDKDLALFERLGLSPNLMQMQEISEPECEAACDDD